MAVLNDFEAAGYGVTAVRADDMVVLNDVEAEPKVGLRETLLHPFRLQSICAFAINANKVCPAPSSIRLFCYGHVGNG